METQIQETPTIVYLVALIGLAIITCVVYAIGYKALKKLNQK